MLSAGVFVSSFRFSVIVRFGKGVDEIQAILVRKQSVNGSGNRLFAAFLGFFEFDFTLAFILHGNGYCLLSVFECFFVRVGSNLKLNRCRLYKTLRDHISAACLSYAKLCECVFSFRQNDVIPSFRSTGLISSAKCSICGYMKSVFLIGIIVNCLEIVVCSRTSVIRGFNDFKWNFENIGVITFGYYRVLM